jgi:hypothetical protein
MAIIFAKASKALEISRSVKAGKLRKLASKIYTDELNLPPEELIRRHRLEIIAYFYPGAVISHRSALEGNVSPAGKIHLTLPRAVAPVRELPGLEIRVWRGPVPQASDARTPLGDGQEVFTSSQARAMLENLQIARAHAGDEPKILSAAELEKWLDRYLRIFGMDWLNKMRQQAAVLAAEFGWHREGQEFNQLVAAIKGEPSDYKLATETMRSRSKGKPYDPERSILFGTLHARLAAEPFKELPKPPVSEFDNRAFWEAYFSNFIEGTKFSVEEARIIVYDQTAAEALKAKRPEDAHDVLETYRLIVDPNVSSEVPKDPSRLLELLKRRHARMMASRPDVEPGVFKKKQNEFGSRVFVAPDLAEETLVRAWSAIQTLPTATARALYALFVIAEVHPFKDGNGRVSRLAMNAELEAASLTRLIIPTSLRIDYLTVLEALTTSSNPDPFVIFAHKLIDINSRMPFTTFDQSLEYFRKTGALDEQSAASSLLSSVFSQVSS